MIILLVEIIMSGPIEFVSVVKFKLYFNCFSSCRAQICISEIAEINSIEIKLVIRLVSNKALDFNVFLAFLLHVIVEIDVFLITFR